MKKLYILIVAICMMNIANAQWQQIGLSCKSVNCITNNGTNIFAGTDTGVFLSSDNSINWNFVNNGIRN